MNKLPGTLAVLLVLSFAATADAAWYAKYDGVDGSSVQTAPTRAIATTSVTQPARATTPTPPPAPTSNPTTAPAPAVQAPDDSQEGSTDYLLEIDGLKGESKEQKGKVESLPIKQKVEGGAQASHGGDVEGDITVLPSAPAPLTPDFSILLGGGTSEADEARRSQIARILLDGAKEHGAPAEQISLNYEKITTKIRHTVKLFGFIPVETTADVDVDAKANAVVHLPWWTFFAQTDAQPLGDGVVLLLADIMASSDALTDGLMLIRS